MTSLQPSLGTSPETLPKSSTSAQNAGDGQDSETAPPVRAGLTPRHRESDLKVARGHITKPGSPLLRWAVVEAIQRQPAAECPMPPRPATAGTPKG